jgi:hypothetical protein
MIGSQKGNDATKGFHTVDSHSLGSVVTETVIQQSSTQFIKLVLAKLIFENFRII